MSKFRCGQSLSHRAVSLLILVTTAIASSTSADTKPKWKVAAHVLNESGDPVIELKWRTFSSASRTQFEVQWALNVTERVDHDAFFDLRLAEQTYVCQEGPSVKRDGFSFASVALKGKETTSNTVPISQAECKGVKAVRFERLSQIVRMRTEPRSDHLQPWIDFGAHVTEGKPSDQSSNKGNDLAFYLGQVASLNHKAEFDVDVDFAIRAETRPHDYVRLSLDLSQSHLGALSKHETNSGVPKNAETVSANHMEGVDDQTVGSATNDTNTEAPPVTPFVSAGAIRRADLSLDLFPFWQWKVVEAALTVGMGAGTLPRPDDPVAAEIAYRGMLGLSFRRGFGAKGNGRLFVGMTEDRLWEAGDYGGSTPPTRRWVIDAQIFGTASKEKGGKVGSRLRWDMPRDGRGPSDLRVSVFYEQDLSKLGDLFGIKGKSK